jgi:hypothetical protein
MTTGWKNCLRLISYTAGTRHGARLTSASTANGCTCCHVTLDVRENTRSIYRDDITPLIASIEQALPNIVVEEVKQRRMSGDLIKLDLRLTEDTNPPKKTWGDFVDG